MNRFTTTALTVATAAATCAAGPLDTKNVSSKATWMIHVDLEAAHHSKLAQSIKAHSEVDDDEFMEIAQALGINPLEDVFSVTAYGSTEDPENPILVFETIRDIKSVFDRIERVSEGEVAVTASKLHGHDAFVLSGGGGDSEEIFAAVRDGSRGRSYVFAAPSGGLLGHGLAVASGEAENLTDSHSRLGGIEARKGTIVMLAATELDKIEDLKNESVAIGQAERVLFQLGEYDGEFFANASLTVADSKDARRLAQIATGGLALIQIMASGDPEMEPFTDLLAGIDIDIHGDTISVSVEWDVDDLLEHMDELEGMDWEEIAEDAETGWWNRQ